MGDIVMDFIKTPDEYNELRNDFSTKIDSFLDDYGKFLDSTSPDYWRGGIYQKIKKLKGDIYGYEPLTLKHLDADWVRDEVLSDEQKEIWDNTKKYNL